MSDQFNWHGFLFDATRRIESYEQTIIVSFCDLLSKSQNETVIDLLFTSVSPSTLRVEGETFM